MAEDEMKTLEKGIISARVDAAFKDAIKDDGELRGHTISEAVEIILKLGKPLYIKKYPQKYERVAQA